MAQNITAFSIVEVAKPNIGENWPARVRADVTINLNVRDHIKHEWEGTYACVNELHYSLFLSEHCKIDDVTDNRVSDPLLTFPRVASPLLESYFMIPARNFPFRVSFPFSAPSVGLRVHGTFLGYLPCRHSLMPLASLCLADRDTVHSVGCSRSALLILTRTRAL